MSPTPFDDPLRPRDDLPVLGAAPGPRPSLLLGLGKMVAGLLLAAIGLGALVGEGWRGGLVAGLIGIPLGLGLRWVGTGGWNVLGQRPSAQASFYPVVLAVCLATVFGPRWSESTHRGREGERWERIKDSRQVADWAAYSREVPERFRRAEWKHRQALARAGEAAGRKNAAELRRVLAEVGRERDAGYEPALLAAAEGLRQVYREAMSRLASPAASAGTVPVDEKLRQAFARLLDDLSRQESPLVHLVFASHRELRAPPASEAVLAATRQDAEVKKSYPAGNAPVIPEGEAFSPAYDQKRRGTFLAAATEAFRRVFSGDLLALAALPEGQSRSGKIVFEVSSTARRTAGYLKYRKSHQDGSRTLRGLLFGIQVEWSFKIFDRGGLPLYQTATRSVPAQHIRISASPRDPPWAPYSVLMDSAYYNYSREVIGRFGLKPPEEKTAFSFQVWR